MVRDDHDDSFDNVFDEIKRTMNDMTGGGAGFASEIRVDVYGEGSILRLVADLPGVDKDAIGLKCDGETLTISAAGDHREYDEHTRLPVRVDEHPASAMFSSGVLQVTFNCVENPAAIDVE